MGRVGCAGVGPRACAGGAVVCRTLCSNTLRSGLAAVPACRIVLAKALARVRHGSSTPSAGHTQCRHPPAPLPRPPSNPQTRKHRPLTFPPCPRRTTAATPPCTPRSRPSTASSGSCSSRATTSRSARSSPTTTGDGRCYLPLPHGGDSMVEWWWAVHVVHMSVCGWVGVGGWASGSRGGVCCFTVAWWGLGWLGQAIGPPPTAARCRASQSAGSKRRRVSSGCRATAARPTAPASSTEAARAGPVAG